ncbi:CAP-associated domain-containing protein [Lysinibacillus parviboronicapiens]|uniref:CAP domain-containing protein n=1 Tax=Lysinibacillus parviboronicapiens TaxID=436516 RepID=UPI000D3A3562|nr:CAP-associated domain-containing protein [Lysinibacillus parviboronicapiens]
MLRKTAPMLFSFSMAFWANASLVQKKGANSKMAGNNSQSLAFMSQPLVRYQSEYNMVWNRYYDDYAQFHLIGTQHGKAVGGYETRPRYKVFGIQIGANRTDVEKKYGSPLTAIHRHRTSYLLTYHDPSGSPTHGTYLIDQHYVTFFYDLHKSDLVRSVTWVSTATEMTKSGYYNGPSEILRTGFEDLMVELINHDRVCEGLQPLIYESKYKRIARQHSSNMITHDFFSHKDHLGNHSNDRLAAGEVNYYWYGENIAYGQFNSIFAHEALMNSTGHRRNILRKEFTHFFVGVSFKDNGAPYYTINFYSE